MVEVLPPAKVLEGARLRAPWYQTIVMLLFYIFAGLYAKRVFSSDRPLG